MVNDGSCMSCVRVAADKALSELNDALWKQFGALHVSNPLALPRNKSTVYRQSVLTFSLGVAEAFDELKLARVNLLERYRQSPEHFYIAAIDLTETGNQFVQAHFNTWLAKTDRWKPESRTVKKFKESLAKELKAFKAM
ncbi:hypothetical protein [Diaphorobacter caeni]|uniref:hypothetical protein n=1 Tax=Diaphorobacter caeni TaxID=2784387 RepID=UPI0018903A45|nr:hypothetical protein [Diaphorobacter caeni]MBF5006706.1 hypothetical protein [Diaphorobacter caeni]